MHEAIAARLYTALIPYQNVFLQVLRDGFDYNLTGPRIQEYPFSNF